MLYDLGFRKLRGFGKWRQKTFTERASGSFDVILGFAGLGPSIGIAAAENEGACMLQYFFQGNFV